MKRMNGTWSFGVAVVVAGLASSANAQSFDYPDFSNVAGVVLNGHALQSGTALRVTPAAGDQKGAAYHAQPMRVKNGFNTVFRFRFDTLVGGGADGMAFVIHNDARGTAAIGGGGGEMGYGWATVTSTTPDVPIANSLVFELDTYFSSSEGDLSANEVSIHTNGLADNDNDEFYSLAHISPTTNLSDGQIHTARVHFNAGVLSFYLDDLNNPLLSVPYDFTTGGTLIGGGAVGGLNLMSGGEAFVGFTSATGGAWENHDVLSWSWNSSGGPGTSYCFGDASGSVCPCGNFSITGEGCMNSMAMGANLDSSGSASVVAADLRFTATQAPQFQSGVFVQANDMQSGGSGSIFGDGLRCVGSNAIFLEMAFTDGVGSATSSVNIITASGITSGQTRTFQYWYRDQQGPCSTGFNTSNGMSVQFTL